MAVTWLKPPQQARSEETLQRMLDAAAQLLEKKPWDEVGVAELAKKAKASVGAFYARFEDKDALLQHLHERWTAEGKANAEAVLALERWQGVPLPEVVRQLVKPTVEEYEARSGFHREIVRRNSFDPKFRARSLEVARVTIALMTDLLEAHGVEEPARTADMAHRILFSVLDQHVQLFEVGELPKGIRKRKTRELVDEITRALLGYLGVE